MGHSIRGFVARPETLAAVSARFPGTKLVALDAGFAWVPATDALMAEIDVADPAGERIGRTIDFVFDHPVMLRLLADLSRSGPIAFVETDYVDGRGAQAATACVDGKVVTSEEGDGRPISPRCAPSVSSDPRTKTSSTPSASGNTAAWTPLSRARSPATEEPG